MCSRICSRTSFTELKNSAIISTQQYMPRRVRRQRVGIVARRAHQPHREQLRRHAQPERGAVALGDVLARSAPPNSRTR